MASWPLPIAGAPAPELETVWERFSWPSRIDRKQEMLTAIEEVLFAHVQFDEGDRHWLRLCLDEALVNALIHGNEGDPAVPVAVLVGARAGRWVVRIDDQGGGFVADQVPDLEDPANLLLEHGRGIRLMQEWLDELRFHRNGATVWMARRMVAENA
jgi:anti-sigma regulatory factor (Ser/Thr protein kinase)